MIQDSLLLFADRDTVSVADDQRVQLPIWGRRRIRPVGRRSRRDHHPGGGAGRLPGSRAGHTFS
jgi:hypothetical protein